MKNRILRVIAYSITITLLMIGCNESKTYKTKYENGISYNIIVMDGCEYIFYKNRNMYGQTLAHKGNCKNH